MNGALPFYLRENAEGHTHPTGIASSYLSVQLCSFWNFYVNTNIIL